MADLLVSGPDRPPGRGPGAWTVGGVLVVAVLGGLRLTGVGDAPPEPRPERRAAAEAEARPAPDGAARPRVRRDPASVRVPSRLLPAAVGERAVVPVPFATLVVGTSDGVRTIDVRSGRAHALAMPAGARPREAVVVGGAVVVPARDGTYAIPLRPGTGAGRLGGVRLGTGRPYAADRPGAVWLVAAGRAVEVSVADGRRLGRAVAVPGRPVGAVETGLVVGAATSSPGSGDGGPPPGTAVVGRAAPRQATGAPLAAGGRWVVTATGGSDVTATNLRDRALSTYRLPGPPAAGGLVSGSVAVLPVAGPAGPVAYTVDLRRGRVRGVFASLGLVAEAGLACVDRFLVFGVEDGAEIELRGHRLGEATFRLGLRLPRGSRLLGVK